MKILVTGAGGFIGGHLVKRLLSDGHDVYGVDVKQAHEWWQLPGNGGWYGVDLRQPREAERVMKYLEPDRVYALAADMGGMGFIKFNDAQILHNNLLINLNTIHAAHKAGVKRYLFTSSVCVYDYDKLRIASCEDHTADESFAYPAQPPDEYGWEKLTSERVLQSYHRDYGMDIRIARLHNTYGPYGTWSGGREKAPAALCRKVAESKLRGDDPISIDVWGDGQATRVFMYVDDCVEGLIRLMESDHTEPLNLGCSEVVSVDDLAMLCYDAAFDGHYWDEKPLVGLNFIEGPQGHRHRAQDNAHIRQVLGGEPNITMAEGLAKTYPWIEERVRLAMEREDVL